MIITNNFDKYETTVGLECTIVSADGSTEKKSDTILHEHFAEVSVNSVPFLRIACTPTNMVELILGRLYTEGVIDAYDDVAQIYICKTGCIAEVTLHKSFSEDNKPGESESSEAITEPTCCTGNKLIANLSGKRQPAKLNDFSVSNDTVFEIARRFKEDSSLHRQTGGTHSCYLYKPDGEIEVFEDLSRHNAMDKAVGYALLNGIALNKCVLYTTGRVPEDMVIKTVMAGVPVLISKSVPTDAAVKAAHEYGLKLIFSAWPDSYKEL